MQSQLKTKDLSELVLATYLSHVLGNGVIAAVLHIILWRSFVLCGNIWLVWRKRYTSKQCQFDVTIIISAAASHTLGYPCLVSLL